MGSLRNEIGRLGEREVLARLEKDSLPTDERFELVRRLSAVGTVASVDALLACAGSSDRRVRVTALRTLTRIGTPAAIDGVIAGLGSPDRVTMSFAARHLESAEVQRAVPALIAALERTESPRDNTGRLAVVSALTHLPHRDSVPILAATLRDRDHTTAKLAAVGLMRISAPEAVTALENAASELSWWRGRHARKALRLRLAAET